MSAAAGQIGPNTLLQLAPVLEKHGGRALRDAVFFAGGVREDVRTDGLIPEGPVAEVHRAMRRLLPERAAALAREAGVGTADYILANRIPRAAQGVLRMLPKRVAARLLAKAIARNAWTFAGSGKFRIASFSPIVFELADNPVVRGEQSDTPLCHWHAAVFERLFQVLVDPAGSVRETRCCACAAPSCRFEFHFGQTVLASSARRSG